MGSANVLHMKKFHTVHISKNTAACQRSPSTVMNSYGDKGVSKFDSGLTAPQQIWDNGAPGHTKATASSDEQALPFPSEKGRAASRPGVVLPLPLPTTQQKLCSTPAGSPFYAAAVLDRKS